MELIQNYFLILLLAVLTQYIDGGIFKMIPLHHQPASELDEIASELNEKEVPITKRQSVPFYVNNPFFSISNFPPQTQEQPQLPNTEFVNYQKPIKIPIQEFSKVPPQQPVVDYGNNPFIFGSLSVPVPPATSTPATTTTPSYVNNPFLNTQQVIGTGNQQVNPNVNTGHISSPLPLNPVVTTTPSFGNNPFLNVHGESVHTFFPVQVTPTTTVRPTVSFTQINPNNPFFNPTAPIPTFSYVPVESPRLPIEPQVQAEQTGQLRSFCAKARGQFPSGRCNTFVNCWDNVAVEQTCPPGLVFNYAGYCDYPQNVECHGRSVEDILVQQPPQTVSLVIDGPTGTSNEVNNHIPSPPTAPVVNTEQSFLPSTTILPPLPDVTNTVSSVVYVPPPVDEKLKARCLKPRGQFPSDLCNRYIDCWDDSVQEHECPEGLYFSEKGYCDYLYNVNCQHRTLPKADIAQSSVCPHPDGSFRDKNNCSKYFICVNNVVAGQYECPEGLDYNEMIGVCDYKYNVNCFREPFVYQPQTQSTIDKVPAGILTATKNCEPGKVFRLTSDCTSAVLCRQGMTEVVYCPNGLAYDAPSDRCLPQQLAKCQDL